MSGCSQLPFSSRRTFPGRPSRRKTSKHQLGVEALERRDLLATGLGVLPGLTDTPAERYVTSLYYDLLQRVPLTAEISGWVTALNAGQSYTAIASGILSSTEYRNNVAQDAYLRLLGRAPVAEEVDFWSHSLQAGLSDRQLQAQFLGSPEDAARQVSLSRDWLTGLYQDTLGRAPDAVGLATWNQLLQQGTSREVIALDVLNSTEANARLVTDVFQNQLGRDPDAVGLSAFVTNLGQGMTTAQMELLITSSPEYIAAPNSDADPTSAGTAAGLPLHFDFGSRSSPLAPGYTRVPLVAYSAIRGFGWANIPGMFWRDRGTPDPLTRDEHLGKDSTFEVKLPDGTYNVTVTLGDAFYPRTSVSVWAQGTQLASGLSSAAGQFLQPTYHVVIANGRLDLRLTAPTTDWFSITGLDISAATTNPPPVLTVAAGPDQTSEEGQAVQFSATASGGTGSLSYLWNFGDGTSASTLNPSHTYIDNGNYTATLTVTDTTGATKPASVRITVQNVAPTVSMDNDYIGDTQTSITFGATVTDPGSADMAAGFRYAWDFGDGTTSTLSAPLHAYAQAGNYTITLVVTDKDGGSTTATATARITDTTTVDVLPTPDGNVPNFGAHPTVVSIHSGAWSDVHTWSTGQLPATGDVVSIAPETTVTYDVVSDAHLKTVAIQAGGHLVFRTDINTRLVVGTILVMPDGELQVGTVDQPVQANVTADIVIADQPIDLTVDPEQFGTSLLVFGKVTMAGAPKSPTFVRLAVEPKAGDSTLTLQDPVSGWLPGDKLVLPDSRQLTVETSGANYSSELEKLALQSVSADGKVLTLTSPLQFDHPGARDAAGVLDFLPHVNNLTRNVILESENPAGTRGQTLFVGRADVDIRSVAFIELGRTQNSTIDNTTLDSNGQVTHIGTNEEGRYPVHFDHLIGPTNPQANGYQYNFVGNTINGADPDESSADNSYDSGYGNPKWGVVIHASDYGLIQDNVVYKTWGAGVATEDASESFNVIAHNSVVWVDGVGGRADHDNDPLHAGEEGAGFWFRGPDNYVRDNVVSDVYGDDITVYGYIYSFVYLGKRNIPTFQGADPSQPGQFVTLDMNATPLLQFEGNEAYGALDGGLTIWWLGTFGTTPNLQTPESVVKDFRVWNATYYGMFLYENYHLTIDGLVVRGQGGIGIFIADYLTYDLDITNADIQGMDVGYGASTSGGDSTQTIENSYLHNIADVVVPNMWTSSYRADYIGSRKVVIRNDQFDVRPLWWSTQTPLAIRMDWDTTGVRNLTASDEVDVYAYNQVSGDDFRVYYTQQAPDYIVPQAVYNSDGTPMDTGAPVAGLTNQQSWDEYHIAIGGAVAPSTAESMAGIGNGLVAPI